MLSLKFPPIHKLIIKDTAELDELDPKRGIVVIEGHAIATTHQSTVCINLKDYFVINNKIDTDDRLEDLEKILNFLENKMFSKPFWEELTKGAIVSINDGKMELDGAIRKDLIYNEEEMDFDPSVIIKTIERNIVSGSASIERPTFYCQPILDVLTAFKTNLKNDSVALEYIGSNSSARFVFDKNHYIFGVISADALLSSKIAVFDSMAFLHEKLWENYK